MIFPKTARCPGFLFPAGIRRCGVGPHGKLRIDNFAVSVIHVYGLQGHAFKTGLDDIRRHGSCLARF